MNCLTARETLDLIRPQEADLYDAEGNELPLATIDDAARHVKDCPACQTAVRRRERFDERIGQLSRELPVPEGLQERLLARLSRENTGESRTGASRAVESGTGESGTGEPQATLPLAAAKPAVRSRRRLFVSALAACVALVACVGIWRLLSPRPLPLTVDEIAGYALSDDVIPAALPLATQFKGGLAVLFPKTIRTEALPLMQPFRQLVDPQLRDREIAISFFTLSDGKRGKFAGILVVVPVAAVKDLPAFTSFPGQTVYRGGYCTTAWVEGEYMYLCCVRGGENVLLRLRPAAPPSA